MPVAHAVEPFALLSGESATSAMGTLSKAQLAVLPATTHFGIVQHAELPALVTRFLNGEG